MSAPRLNIAFVLARRFTLSAYANFVDVLRLAADEGDRSRPILCRWAVIGSVLVFGAATCGISSAPGIVTIAVLRFIAGLGIGGALPSSTTMTAEFTPARRRTLAVTATIVCVPLGGMVAA